MTQARTAGRPRSPKADAPIVRATLDVLLDDGYRALSVEQVARKASVGSATIYRRHASKQELVAAAVAAMPEAGDSGNPVTLGQHVTDEE